MKRSNNLMRKIAPYVLSASLTSGLLIGCDMKMSSEEIFYESAKVVSKEYKPQHFDVMTPFNICSDGNLGSGLFGPTFCPENYIIKLKGDNGEEFDIKGSDKKSLYDELFVGQWVYVTYKKHLDHFKVLDVKPKK